MDEQETVGELVMMKSTIFDFMVEAWKTCSGNPSTTTLQSSFRTLTESESWFILQCKPWIIETQIYSELEQSMHSPWYKCGAFVCAWMWACVYVPSAPLVVLQVPGTSPKSATGQHLCSIYTGK